MKIILLGYMGCGKSTVGKLLSARMFLPFIDLDSYIEKKEKKSIPKIFEESGEIQFRLKEHFYLQQLLNKKENFILSLGGGTPCYANNIQLILSYKNVTSIYLKATIKTLTNRLLLEKEKRPLIANIPDNELTEFIAKHLFERSFFYEQAKLKISTSNKTIEKVTTELHKLLH